MASGSFTQLPPVPKKVNHDIGQYCFESSIFTKSIPHHVHLVQMLRRKEGELANLVRELELGSPSDKSEELLKFLERPLVNVSESNYTTVLLGTNFAVDCYNQEKMQVALGEAQSHKAIDKGNSNVIIVAYLKIK